MDTISRAIAGSVRSGLRAAMSLLVAGAAITTPAVTSADDAPGRPIAQRMELILKSINVLDDREPWWEPSGEMTLNVEIWRVKKDPGCARWTTDPKCMDVVTSSQFNFSAGEGDTVAFNRSLPVERSGGEGSAAVAPGIGFPLYLDDVYGLSFNMTENDLTRPDHMGFLLGEMSRENGWGPPGVYDERGWVKCDNSSGTFTFCHPWIPTLESPFNPPNEKPAYYRVHYELRVVPTPDLRVGTFRYDPQRDALCMGVTNGGT